MDSIASLLVHQVMGMAGLACLFPVVFCLLVLSACRGPKPVQVWRKR
jgi:hypothetical protein